MIKVILDVDAVEDIVDFAKAAKWYVRNEKTEESEVAVSDNKTVIIKKNKNGSYSAKPGVTQEKAPYVRF